jgi:hypothetical protein
MKKRKAASTRKTTSTRKLARYHDKRFFARTPYPTGAAGGAGAGGLQ